MRLGPCDRRTIPRQYNPRLMFTQQYHQRESLSTAAAARPAAVLLAAHTWWMVEWVSRLWVGVSGCAARPFLCVPVFFLFSCAAAVVGVCPRFFVPVGRSILDVKSLG